MWSTKKINDFLGAALDSCTKLGATACEAIVVTSENESVSIREKIVDGVERAETAALGLRLFVGKRAATVSTSDFSEAAIKATVEKGIAIAKAVPEDPYIGIAESAQLATEFKDFDVADKTVVSPQKMIDWALEAEAAAFGDKRVTASRGAGFSRSYSQSTIATSAGFFGQRAGSSFGGGVHIIATDNGQASTGYQGTSAPHFSDLKTAQAVGALACKEACAGLNAIQIPSEKLPIFIEREAAASFLSHFLGMINGDAVSTGMTLLKDAMGTAVFSPEVTIIDDPHRLRHFGATGFDDEGLPTKRCTFVKEGILQSWILDLKRARKLGLAPTGHGARGLSSPPYPQAHAPYIQAGKQSPEEIIASMGRGIVITDFMGSAVSLMTGDYSRGFMGFLVEDGQKVKPLREMTLSGNLKDIFKALIPASDLLFEHGINSPGLYIPAPMSISGA